MLAFLLCISRYDSYSLCVCVYLFVCGSVSSSNSHFLVVDEQHHQSSFVFMWQQFRQMEAQFVAVVGGFVERRSRFVFTYRVERAAE